MPGKAGPRLVKEMITSGVGPQARRLVDVPRNDSA
jgi:hypothetical protein